LAISSPTVTNPRQVALSALRDVARGAYADAALERGFGRAQLTAADRHLATELVYGTVRQRRTLDAMIALSGSNSGGGGGGYYGGIDQGKSDGRFSGPG
jgi:NusB family